MNLDLPNFFLPRFFRGFSYPLRAFRFLNDHPGLYRFVAIPLLINMVVFSLVGYYGFAGLESMLSHYLPAEGGWYWQLLRYFLQVVAGLVALGLFFFTFATLGALIAAPFNELLSARTEEARAGVRHEEPFSFALFIGEARLALAVEIKKIFFFVGGMVLLLPLHFLPGVGTLLYGAFSLAWTIFFLVVEYAGYSLTRNRFTFAAQRRLILAQAPLLLGFGSALFCLLLIPLLQFFCIPLGVVGATLLLHDHGLLAKELRG